MAVPFRTEAMSVSSEDRVRRTEIKAHVLTPRPTAATQLPPTAHSAERQEALSVAAVSVGHVPEAVASAVHAVAAAASVVTDNGKRYV